MSDYGKSNMIMTSFKSERDKYHSLTLPWNFLIMQDWYEIHLHLTQCCEHLHVLWACYVAHAIANMAVNLIINPPTNQFSLKCLVSRIYHTFPVTGLGGCLITILPLSLHQAFGGYSNTSRKAIKKGTYGRQAWEARAGESTSTVNPHNPNPHCLDSCSSTHVSFIFCWPLFRILGAMM